MTNDYFRGLAKIAFHGALRLVPTIWGAEECFSPLGEYVLGIGAARPDDFVQPSDEPIIEGQGEQFNMVRWGHLIAVEGEDGVMQVRLQFFVGPGFTPRTWVVTIVRNAAEVWNGSVAYYCRYFDERSDDGHDGDMIEL